MDKKTLTSLFAESLFQIPDYQRGYAWEEKQLNDFIQDIDALVEEDATSHYTGTVVVYSGRNVKIQDYDRKRLKIVDVVDGQQRLTTCCLYLSVIINSLIEKGEQEYEHDIPSFLYSGAISKLALNNDTNVIFYTLLKSGMPHTAAQSPHEKRLIDAHILLQDHITKQLIKSDVDSIAYLKNIYLAITQKLHFTFYTLEEECEIGMTFELMNSRGKQLSVLELLKNYLMHWVSRNEDDIEERTAMISIINNNWKAVYKNLGSCAGDEDQCLRIAWTLYCSHSPAHWIGYDGFKGDEYIPLRNFTKRTKASTKAFIHLFTNGLAEISRHYASIINPTQKNAISQDELLWLTKIHHTGNIANFLPLMVAARKHRENKNSLEQDYISLLRSLECFAYRVFIYTGRRSNAGKSSFHRLGFEIFNATNKIINATTLVHALTRNYSTEEDFIKENAEPTHWYSMQRLVKYTLYEYELNLLATEGHGKQPCLTWEDLNDSTIEHILPQTPKEKSVWEADWNKKEFDACLHDIANLVLTQDNSRYLNFEFSRKKGLPGQSPSYSNSDFRQERKIAKFSNWTPKEFYKRRIEMIDWINARWKTEGNQITPMNIIAEDDDVN